MSSELEEVKANFTKHKAETQRRLDQLTKIDGFQWETYQQTIAAAALVPGLQAELAAAAQREAAAAKEIRIRDDEIGRLRAQIESITAEMQAGNRERADLRSDVAGAREDLSNLRRMFEAAEQKIASLEAAK